VDTVRSPPTLRPFYEAGSVKSKGGSIGLTFYPVSGIPRVRGFAAIQLLQVTQPILRVELKAPRGNQAFVLSIEHRFAVFPNPNPGSWPAPTH